MTLITTNTSSGAASSSFTSSIDSTYKLYIFKFYDVNPVTDNTNFRFKLSTDGGSSYGVTKTSTFFYATHDEDDGATSFAYSTSSDLAQSTNPQDLGWGSGSGADESAAGELYLFNPSNTTYVKHWYSRMQEMSTNPRSQDMFTAGYANTTSAINAVQFLFSSGNMDAVIKMYGVG